MQDSSSSEQLSLLLRLPPELRLRIYNYLARPQTYQSRHHRTLLTADGDAVSVYVQRRDLSAVLPMLQTCGMLHKEVKDFIYSRAVFTVVVQNQAWEAAVISDSSAAWNKVTTVLHDLSFLKPVRRLMLRAGIRGPGTAAAIDANQERTTLAKLAAMLDALSDGGMLKEFHFDMFFWDVDRLPSDIAYCIDKSGSGVAILGPKTGQFRTRRLEAASEVVSKLQSLLA